MKYYKLVKDLPTFKAGELFRIAPSGSLVNVPSSVVAYSVTTLEKFPNILEDWFMEVPEPIRDNKTKEAFIEYLDKHKAERFFQAVLNFTSLYLDGKVDRVCCHRSYRKAEWCDDTFYWECDNMLKEEEEE